jgi:tricorn protease
VSIARRGAPAGAAVDHVRMTDTFEDLALSPDGKKVVFSARGDLFAASAKDGGDAVRITATPAIDTTAVWTPDSRRLVYIAGLGETSELHVYDFGTNADATLTTGHRDYTPALAPNGERVAFLRGGSELCVVPLTPAPAKDAPCMAKAAVPTSLDSSGAIAWSPDNKWIAFVASGAKSFSNVQVIAATGGDAKPVSFLANVSTDSIAWSPDGTFLVFNTAQRTEQGQVARVDLVLRTPKFREDQFRDLFPSQPSTPDRPAPTSPSTPAETKPDEKKDEAKKEEAKKDTTPKKPTEIVFDDIRRRLGYLPVGVDVGSLAISPDGKTLLLNASSEGQQNLYTWSLDELAKERPVARQLTSTAGPKSDAQFSPDSKEVYYLEDGRIQIVTLERREPRPLAVNAELDVDFTIERRTVFTQAWSLLNEHFYDASFHGISWTQARDRVAPYIASAATRDEMQRLTALMIGELNASHLGISPGSPSPSVTGRLGLRFDRDEYARGGRLRIADVIPLGPAAVTRAIAIGDVLVAVNGTPITRTTNLDRLLEHTIGKRVTLSIESKGQAKRDVAVQPVNLATERGLLYRQWVESRRAYVAKASNGRLGYVHMADMSAQSLAQLYVDLDSENHSRDGVVIDVRNNNGGFVNAYALDVFARRPYLNMTLRGRPTAPARTMLGQRALESPTILVTNQHSLSDAEDFTEGYRRLKLGKVVGEPTAGWIIYTWGGRLVDGSALRLPRMRITDADGKDMEMAPRPVDIPATRQPGEVAAGKDTQLDVAVRELLAQIDGANGGRRPTTPSLR